MTIFAVEIWEQQERVFFYYQINIQRGPPAAGKYLFPNFTACRRASSFFKGEKYRYKAEYGY